MVPGFANRDIAPALEDDFTELYGKVRDWQAFQKLGGNSFAMWCSANGREYKWLQTHYFKP